MRRSCGASVARCRFRFRFSRGDSSIYGSILMSLIFLATVAAFQSFIDSFNSGKRDLVSSVAAEVKRAEERVWFRDSGSVIYASSNAPLKIVALVVYNSTHVLYMNTSGNLPVLMPGVQKPVLEGWLATEVSSGRAVVGLLSESGVLHTYDPVASNGQNGDPVDLIARVSAEYIGGLRYDSGALFFVHLAPLAVERGYISPSSVSTYIENSPSSWDRDVWVQAIYSWGPSSGFTASVLSNLSIGRVLSIMNYSSLDLMASIVRGLVIHGYTGRALDLWVASPESWDSSRWGPVLRSWGLDSFESIELFSSLSRVNSSRALATLSIYTGDEIRVLVHGMVNSSYFDEVIGLIVESSDRSLVVDSPLQIFERVSIYRYLEVSSALALSYDPDIGLPRSPAQVIVADRIVINSGGKITVAWYAGSGGDRYSSYGAWGGSGGGSVIILARQIIFNGGAIEANGQDAYVTSWYSGRVEYSLIPSNGYAGGSGYTPSLGRQGSGGSGGGYTDNGGSNIGGGGGGGGHVDGYSGGSGYLVSYPSELEMLRDIFRRVVDYWIMYVLNKSLSSFSELILFGGSGGGGSQGYAIYNQWWQYTIRSGSGGGGGGFISMYAGEIDASLTSYIYARGGRGLDAVTYRLCDGVDRSTGGGGGGSGGAVYIFYRAGSVSGLVIDVSGGDGGEPAIDCERAGSGDLYGSRGSDGYFAFVRVG